MGKASKRKALRKQGLAPSRSEYERQRQEKSAQPRLAEDPVLSRLIDHTANLKGELCRYIERRPLLDVMLGELPESIRTGRVTDPALIAQAEDNFIFRYRFPDGSTVIDHFLSQRRGLSEADRETLLAWRNPVEGVFEVRRKRPDSVVLLNLVDDVEYPAYSNLGARAFSAVQVGWFMEGRLVPVGGAWVISGSISIQIAGHAREMALRAQAAIDATAAEARPSGRRVAELLGSD